MKTELYTNILTQLSMCFKVSLCTLLICRHWKCFLLFKNFYVLMKNPKIILEYYRITSGHKNLYT